MKKRIVFVKIALVAVAVMPAVAQARVLYNNFIPDWLMPFFF